MSTATLERVTCAALGCENDITDRVTNAKTKRPIYCGTPECKRRVNADDKARERARAANTIERILAGQLAVEAIVWPKRKTSAARDEKGELDWSNKGGGTCWDAISADWRLPWPGNWRIFPADTGSPPPAVRLTASPAESRFLLKVRVARRRLPREALGGARSKKGQEAAEAFEEATARAQRSGVDRLMAEAERRVWSRPQLPRPRREPRLRQTERTEAWTVKDRVDTCRGEKQQYRTSAAPWLRGKTYTIHREGSAEGLCPGVPGDVGRSVGEQWLQSPLAAEIPKNARRDGLRSPWAVLEAEARISVLAQMRRDRLLEADRDATAAVEKAEVASKRMVVYAPRRTRRFHRPGPDRVMALVDDEEFTHFQETCRSLLESNGRT